MPYFFFHRFRFTAAVPPIEAIARLSAAVAPQAEFVWGRPYRPFAGSVAGDQFSIRPAVRGKPGSVAQVRGRVVASPGGSRVEGTTRVAYDVLLFLFLWTAVAALAAALLWDQFDPAHPLGAPLFIPLGMLVIGWSFCIASFTGEARAAIQLIAQQLDGPAPGIVS